MPEGDVVRLTAARLDAALTGRLLVRADLRWPGVALVDLRGQSVLGTVARGKHLLTRLGHGWTLHTHLRMDGSWLVARTGGPVADRGPFVRVVLGNEQWSCVGHRLGMVDVVRTRDERTVVGHLGPDILDDDLRASGGLDLMLANLRSDPPTPRCRSAPGPTCGRRDRDVLHGRVPA